MHIQIFISKSYIYQYHIAIPSSSKFLTANIFFRVLYILQLMTTVSSFLTRLDRGAPHRADVCGGSIQWQAARRLLVHPGGQRPRDAQP